MELAVDVIIVWKRLSNSKNDQKMFREQLKKSVVMYNVHWAQNPQRSPWLHDTLENPLRLKKFYSILTKTRKQ